MDVVGSIIGLCLALCAAGWTFEDARKRGMDAASALVWALGVASQSEAVPGNHSIIDGCFKRSVIVPSRTIVTPGATVP